MSKTSGTGQGYFPPGYGFMGDSPPHDYDPTTGQIIKDIQSGKASIEPRHSIQQDLLKDLAKFSIKPPSIGGDLCNIIIQSNGSVFGLKIPPSPIALRNPACRLPSAPPPPTVQPSTNIQYPPYVPAPRNPNSFYVAIANGNESLTLSDPVVLNNNNSASLDFSVEFVDFRYPLDVFEANALIEGFIDITVNGSSIAAYFRNDSINPYYTPEERASFQYWQAYGLDATVEYPDRAFVEFGDYVCYFILNFEAALNFCQVFGNTYFDITQNQGADNDGGNVISRHIKNLTWTIFEIYGDNENKPYYPPPPPPPPLPTMPDCCNCDLLKAIYAQVQTLPSPIPLGWEIRPEYNRPQVIYQFAKVDSNGNIIGSPNYPITVPHHLPTQPTTGLPNYIKGNWEIIYVLDDNSKITIHSKDESNGMLVLNAILPRLDPNFTKNPYLSKSCLVVTTNQLQQVTVKCRLAKYFSTGAQNDLPDWIAKW